MTAAACGPCSPARACRWCLPSAAQAYGTLRYCRSHGRRCRPDREMGPARLRPFRAARPLRHRSFDSRSGGHPPVLGSGPRDAARPLLGCPAGSPVRPQPSRQGHPTGLRIWNWHRPRTHVEAFRHNFGRRLGTDAARWHELHSRARTPAEDRELAILQWSVDFVDPDTARDHAERRGTPWLGIGHKCADNINIEVRHYLQDHDVPGAVPRSRRPDVDHRWRPGPATTMGGRLAGSGLPDVQRVTLVGAGHIPWAEDPQGFREATARFLSVHDRVIVERVRGEPLDRDSSAAVYG